jgi:hypothetical protein
MFGRLSDELLVPVLINACEALLKKHQGHRLYSFLTLGSGKSRRLVIVPQYAVVESSCNWSEEDKATIGKWLAAEKGFRVFMPPTIRSRYCNPVVDHVDGKLVLRTGKRKMIPLE